LIFGIDFLFAQYQVDFWSPSLLSCGQICLSVSILQFTARIVPPSESHSVGPTRDLGFFLSRRSVSFFPLFPSLRLSPALCSKFYTLKEYSLSFTVRILFCSIIFFNHPYSVYSKFIIYINYHPYFIIFLINNFFSLIPSQLTSYYYFLF
jgi:hypothetical protein